MTNTENAIDANIELNERHRIFEGHFPGQPIVPGVCLMQMIKEILETAIGKKTRLIRSDYAKFLAMLDPREHKTIHAAIQYHIAENGEIEVVASLVKEALFFLKYKAVFVVAGHD